MKTLRRPAVDELGPSAPHRTARRACRPARCAGRAGRAGPAPRRPSCPTARERRTLAQPRLEIALFVGRRSSSSSAFVLVPIGLAGYYSFFKWNGFGPLDDFVGLDNYRPGARPTRSSSARSGTTSSSSSPRS